MTLAEALQSAQTRLVAHSDSPRQDAEILLGHVLGLSRGQLFARLREPLAADDAASFERLVARRQREEPVAYITGEKGFWTLSLKVTPAVLVPRPETELLVEWGLELLGSPLPLAGEGPGERASGNRNSTETLSPNPSPARGRGESVADLGTGSGAIALALASERPQARVVATEASPEALAVARANAKALARERVDFREGHWCEPLGDERFDLIVSNPPYIAAQDPHLPALRHEPLAALTDGADGLQALREIIASAPSHLKPGAWLLVEHGYDQGEAVRALFRAAGYLDIETRRDLGGQERVTGGRHE